MDGIRSERFLLAESEELTVSPWEWRQWWLEASPHDSSLPAHFENRPLFQTVDIPAINALGPLRDSFLAFVEENAHALDEQRVLLPAVYRPLSIRVNAGVPWVALDLEGVRPALLATYPKLRQHIESVGCAGCHAAADVVQVRADRSFSLFYEKNSSHAKRIFIRWCKALWMRGQISVLCRAIRRFFLEEMLDGVCGTYSASTG